MTARLGVQAYAAGKSRQWLSQVKVAGSG